MQLPDLTGWESTRDGLHRASQVLGVLRVAGAPPQANDLHYSLEVIDAGASSGKLDNGLELQLHYGEAALRIATSGSAWTTIPLDGHSQISLLDATLDHLRVLGLPLVPKLQKITHSEPLVVDPTAARRYAAVQARIVAALNKLRRGLPGTRTPVVLWPHHFDVAFLRFTTDGTDEHKHPQIGTGFAPQSEGFPDPYLYVYAWPLPDGLDEVALPAPARWVSEGFTGAVVDYAALAATPDPEALVTDALSTLHRLITSRM